MAVDTSASPISTLPAEPLLDILLTTLDFDISLLPQLHTLAQVCKYWFHFVISNSRFWRVIDLEHAGLAPMILKRNPKGPLAVRCCLGRADALENFMEMARNQAHRWDALTFSGNFNEDRLRFFDIPTPALVALNVSNGGYKHHTLPLSFSPALRHVEVDGIRLRWDSLCLSGLKSIAINSTIPSLPQLVVALCATPALEWLLLRGTAEREDYEGDGVVLEHTISLPALRGLYLQYPTGSLIRHRLLTTIDGPQCRILDARIPFHLFQHPGPTFGKLVAIPVRAADRVLVRYDGSHAEVNILSPALPVEQDRVGWRRETDDAHVSISVGNIPCTDPNALESIANALSLNPSQMDVIFSMHDRPRAAESTRLFGGRPAILDSTTRIYFGENYRQENSISDLRFLATSVIENGRRRWPCPRLTNIAFSSMSKGSLKRTLYAILEFLEERTDTMIEDGWSMMEAEAGTKRELPVPLEVIEAGEVVIERIRGAKAVKGLELVVALPVPQDGMGQRPRRDSW